MEPQHKARLEHLIKILEGVPPGQFEMENWITDTTRRRMLSYLEAHPEATSSDAEAAVLAKDCGTAACAVGWAMADPLFRQQGFTCNRYGVPEFCNKENWVAVRSFFGLTEGTANLLFTSTTYFRATTPKEVIQRIEVYLAQAQAQAEAPSCQD